MACDLCHAALATDVARVQTIRGRVSFLMRQQWRVDPRPAGQRSLLTCRACADYLDEAIQHLRNATRTASRRRVRDAA